MKKALLSIVLVLVLIGANFVLRYIHIRGVEDTIGAVSNKLSENGLKFSYKEIRYDGFTFWKVDGQIVDPVLLQEKHEYSDKSSFDYIAFTSTLISKKIIINLSNKINTVINDSEGEHQYVSTFTTNPQVDIKFNGYFMTHNKFLRQNELGQYFIKYINHLYYHSAGHKAVKVNKITNTDELIYTIGNFDMEIKNQNTEKYDDCEIKIQLNESRYNKTSFGEDYFELLANAGKTNYTLNANLLLNFKDESKIALNDAIVLENVKPIYKVKVSSFKLLTEPYSLEMTGDAVVSRSQILPYFDMDINVVNFDNMLEFYSKFYNTLITKIDVMRALSLQAITEKQKQAVLTLFRKIATKSKHDSYSVNMTKLKVDTIKIGEYSVDNVVEMYNDLMSEKKDNQ